MLLYCNLLESFSAHVALMPQPVILGILEGFLFSDAGNAGCCCFNCVLNQELPIFSFVADDFFELYVENDLFIFGSKLK